MATTRRDVPGDIIFHLGKLTQHRRVLNEGVLRDLAGAIHSYIGADMTYIAAHEGPITEGATDCAVIGPWETDQSERFLDLSRWAAEDRVVALQLDDHAPDTFHKRSDLIDEELFRDSALFKEFHAPMSLGDASMAYHESPEGTKMVVAIGAVSTREPLDPEAVERAEAVFPYLTRAFDEAWKPVPGWAHELRPQARRILQHIIDGLDDEHIAAHTGLTYHSVRAHLKRLFRVAQVRSRLHLMQAYLHGVTSEDLDEQVERINRKREKLNAGGSNNHKAKAVTAH